MTNKTLTNLGEIIIGINILTKPFNVIKVTNNWTSDDRLRQISLFKIMMNTKSSQSSISISM